MVFRTRCPAPLKSNIGSKRLADLVQDKLSGPGWFPASRPSRDRPVWCDHATVSQRFPERTLCRPANDPEGRQLKCISLIRCASPPCS
jgi:hypothetical protein